MNRHLARYIIILGLLAVGLVVWSIAQKNKRPKSIERLEHKGPKLKFQYGQEEIYKYDY
ncbi:MAG: hypothetical protein NZO16_03710 [Deltaproteobacteria bacterium]|nr:hypothetical protein [Deltaproteobacteria bacterium]